MLKSEIKISGNLSGRTIFRVPVMVTTLIIFSLLLSSQNSFAQSAVKSSDASVGIQTAYSVTAFTLPGDMWGYLIKYNGVNVFISHDRGTGAINAPDYNTEAEALIAGELKIKEIEKLSNPSNSITNKNE